jgi:dTDP-4-dehydrorhamnose 3,5-epimerase-like enzyme
MLNEPFLINGNCYLDKRGQVSFVNDFNFSDIRRFYVIKNKSTKIIRAWQGHRIEKKYFYVVKGSFLICAVQIDNWENPSNSLSVKQFILPSVSNQMLVIPPGYATGLKSLSNDSYLLVYSNLSLNESKKDDYRFPAEWWYDWS